MNTNEIKIRPATEADAAEILSIYAPYITDTAITFEYDVPTLEEFTGRIRHTLKKYPYLVAVRDSEIIGYAYAGGIIELVYIVLQSVVKPGITGFFKIDLHIKCYIYLS